MGLGGSQLQLCGRYAQGFMQKLVAKLQASLRSALGSEFLTVGQTPVPIMQCDAKRGVFMCLPLRM